MKRHPYLVRTRSIHCETDLTLLANEAINGFTLMSLVARRGRLSPDEARHLCFELDRLLKMVEKKAIDLAMRESDGNVSKAAEMLGINRTTLYGRMDRLEGKE